MPFRLFTKKDLSLFPPYLTKGDSWIFQIRRFYLETSEIISSIIGILIFFNFIFFCGKQDEVDLSFRIINFILSFAITADFIIKYKFLKKLYMNKNFYGMGFVMIDIVSGPISLVINIYNVVITEEVAITVSDILLLLRIFCLEKIRLLIKDVVHILYVSRYINFALLLTYYVYSYTAYAIFKDVSPKFFRNIFKSMLSMFQVLTLDSWNLQVNQSVSQYYGQAWSVFFLFFILFMFFYFINLLLGAFVSYYSNPSLRMNFEYDYQHDEILNEELNLEFRNSIQIKDALQKLDLDQTPYQQARKNWGLNEAEVSVYIYITLQIICSMIQLFSDTEILWFAQVVFEICFGVYFCILFYWKTMQFKQFRRECNNQFEEKQQDTTFINEEYAVRLYVVIILLLAGPCATVVDIIQLSLGQGIRFGPMLRVFIVLSILYVQKLLFKFVEVLPGVSHIIIFVAGILFTMALIGHQFIKVDVGYPLFDTLTHTYLFMLQVVTFDSWGDVARIVIHNQAIYVFYFLFLTIFVGFFLMNMLVGVMATMTQPKTQELFEKDHIMRQRVNEVQVSQLKLHIEQFKKSEQSELKQILEEFNSSKNTQPLYIIVDGIKYEVTTKNFIQLD